MTEGWGVCVCVCGGGGGGREGEGGSMSMSPYPKVGRHNNYKNDAHLLMRTDADANDWVIT